MKLDQKKLWSMIFLGMLVAVTFYYLLRDREISDLLGAIHRVHPLYLLGGLLLMFLFVLCEAANTRGLLRAIGHRRSIWSCLKYAMIGFYFSSVTPSASGGQPMQVYYMKQDGVSIGAGSLDMMLITLSYQSGMVLLGGVLFFLRMPLIFGRIGVLGYFLLYGMLTNLLCIGLFFCVVFHKNLLSRAAEGCVRLGVGLRLVKNPEQLLEKLERQMEEYRCGAVYLRKNIRVLLRMFCVTLVQLLSRLSIPFLLYKAFGLNGFGYLDVLALQTMLALSVESLPLPGAVGVSEAGFLAVNSVIFGQTLLFPAMLISRGISYYGFLLISGGTTLAAHVGVLRKAKSVGSAPV